MSLDRLSPLSERERSIHGRSRQQPQPGNPVRHPILDLQNKLGNARVARFLAQREAEEDELQAKHDPALLQREAEEEEELQAKHDSGAGQARIGLDGGPLDADLQQRIESKRGSGSSLGDGIRSTMEGAFGQRLEHVRVHRDSESDALNRSMTAKAFTTGSDIFLRNDADPSDRSLMAHELTHVVQQSSMGGGGGGMSVGPAGSDHEHEADAVAQAVTSGALDREIDNASD